MNTAKKTVLSLPLVGPLTRKMVQILRIRRDVQQLKNDSVSQRELLHQLYDQNQKLEASLQGMKQSIKAKQEEADKRSDMFMDKLHALRNSFESVTNTSDKHTAETTKGLFADNHSLDRFYVEFENRFRGSEELIIKRLEYYLGRFKALRADFKKYPVLDIGCGRGEMLSLLKSNKINALGVDLNEDMVKSANKKNLQAVQADALEYLKKQKTSSLSAITGFHIIEHIPFELIIELFQESLRVLRKGGFILLETPNPENIEVATINFYLDPSHLHPLPPSLIEFTAMTQGYEKVEIDRLHATEMPGTSLDFNKEGDARIISRFTAAQDYSIIAYK